jgi:LL-diaminopimelate aminotransferase
MAGWRTGVVVGKAGILKKLLTLKTNADSGQFLPILRAAETALSLPDTWHRERNQVYRERRDMVIDALESEGLSILPPQGGMYVWVPLPPGWDGFTFSKELLATEHVSVTPGGVFGAQGADHIRIALTQPLPRLEKALKRLRRSWAAHPANSP